MIIKAQKQTVGQDSN